MKQKTTFLVGIEFHNETRNEETDYLEVILEATDACSACKLVKKNFKGYPKDSWFIDQVVETDLVIFS